jgi:hypothetical protein
VGCCSSGRLAGVVVVFLLYALRTDCRAFYSISLQTNDLSQFIHSTQTRKMRYPLLETSVDAQVGYLQDRQRQPPNLLGMPLWCVFNTNGRLCMHFCIAALPLKQKKPTTPNSRKNIFAISSSIGSQSPPTPLQRSLLRQQAKASMNRRVTVSQDAGAEDHASNGDILEIVAHDPSPALLFFASLEHLLVVGLVESVGLLLAAAQTLGRAEATGGRPPARNFVAPDPTHRASS